MRGAERGVSRIDHHDGFARARFPAIQQVARKDPGMPGRDPIGRPYD